VAQKFTVPITVKQLASAGSDAVTVFVDADTFARLKVEAGGRLTWGSGASAGDVNLYRASADVLQTDDTFKTPVLFVDNIEIDPTGATTDQVLKFNGTKFIASTVSSGAINLDGLTDVTITSATNGQILVYNGTNWVNTVRPSNEPMGHENKDDSVISFNEGTRTFSIAPASTSYTVWCAGKRFVKTGTETVQIPDTSGLYYIYFNSSGVLSYRTSYFVWDTDAPTAYIYWNEVDNKAYFFADERHGITLDWATHEYLHRTRGAAIANGFGANNYILDGNGSLDSHAKLDIANGTFFDEDLQVDIVHSATPTPNTWQQVLQGNAKIPAFYRLNSHWVKDTATEFPLKQGTDRPRYNLNTAGTWSTPDVANNHFGVSWIIATNNLNEPIIAIIGQDSYSHNGAAQAEFYASLNLDGFPIVEFRPLYKIIYECKNSYTNTPSARITDVLDLRSVISSDQGVGTTPVYDHGSMTGLADDDHTQYLTDARHNALDHSTAMASVVLDDIYDVNTSGASAGDVLTYNGSAWTSASAGGGASLEVSATAPASPEVGDLWFNSATLETYIYYDNHWLQTSGEPDLVEDITDLSDVTLTTPVNGQFLKYDGTRWVNGTIPTINTLDDIGDVSVSSPSSGQFLKWNGTAWVAETIIGGATISDTAPASPLAGQLWFQSTNGKTFVYYDSSWIEVGGVGSGARMVSSSSAPASPLEGSMWFDTDTAQTFVYYDSQWIEIGASGVTASVQDSAPAAPVSGQIWFNSLTGGTYVYYGTNWIEVGASPFSALVNTINAKGDLLVGTADNTIGGLGVGSANQVLTVDSSTATGLKWATPVSTGKAIAMSIVFGG